MEIDKLTSMIGRPDGDWVADFELAAEEYYQQHGAAALLPLMRTLGDHLPDDMNFSVIHIIEQADSSQYAKALIDLVIERDGRAEYWLNVLHFRVFNSSPDIKAYAYILRLVDLAGKERVSRYFAAVISDQRNAKFLPQISLLQKLTVER